MVIAPKINFSLRQIALSGQCFRMNMTDDTHCKLIADDRCLELEETKEEIRLLCSETEFSEYWEEYFDLKYDYTKIIDAIDPEDKYLKAAAVYGSGIRILRQDLWETIVSFLISQQNNITRIKRCISNVCEKYGKKLFNNEGQPYYAFPRADVLASLDEDSLCECNLGYRSKYVVRTAREISEGKFDLDLLKTMDYRSAHEYLKRLYGVGTKVADCICLFGLHKTEAFPVDTHIKQVFEAHYKQKPFPFERYDGFAGILQQYMFFYDLHRQEV